MIVQAYVLPTIICIYVFAIFVSFHRYLELSLPKFSMTAVTDLRSLLSDMALDKLLLGSDANFQRLSTKGNFTVDKVNLLSEYYVRLNHSNPVWPVQCIFRR